MNLRQCAAWAGMVGPILFIAIFTIEGWLRPGYSSAGMYISELSLGPRGWIQITNFIVFGVLFLVFAFGIAIEFRAEKASLKGPILLIIIATCFLFSGPFVADPANTLPEQLSWHGTLHLVFGAMVFSLSPVSCFVFFRRFQKDPKWHSLQWWTLIEGAIMTVAVVLMSEGQKNPLLLPNALNSYIGLIQRVVIITYLSWIFTFALKYSLLR